VTKISNHSFSSTTNKIATSQSLSTFCQRLKTRLFRTSEHHHLTWTICY